jgi:DNA modification methylase
MPTLNWIGKEAVVNHDQQVPYRLIHCNGDLSVGEAGAGNLLVEGDNLHALKALLPYYRKQVKCIYIDPPYNTGNEGWVYNDNVNSPEIKKWLGETVGGEAEDLSRHDKWLCMMYPRLKLLREFLRDDGAIFISIDDNEVARLRCVMDEIFGQRNFVTNIIWHKIYAPKGSARHFSESHDYILVYAKNSDLWQRHLIPRSEKQDRVYKNPDNDPRGLWRPNNLAARNYYSLGTYSITTPSGRVIPGPPKGQYWRISKQRLEELDREGRIWWGKDGNNVPAPKIYLSEVQQGVVPQTNWHYDEVGHTQEAKKEIVALLPNAEEVFSTPKPTRLIKRILQIATDKDSLVLDSFAGSGTTGHAVLQLNKEDGGNRRFILIEMEPDICRDITAERLRRVIEGRPVGSSRPDRSEEGLGGGFRYCRLGESLFDERGQIRDKVKFGDLAHHIFFTETGEPLPRSVRGRGPLIGELNGTAYYLLWNGPDAENILDFAALKRLNKHDGPKVVYADGCRLPPSQLRARNITFKQIPYEVRAG